MTYLSPAQCAFVAVNAAYAGDPAHADALVEFYLAQRSAER